MAALTSRVGDSTPTGAQARGYINFSRVNKTGQTVGVSPWNNAFLLKSLFVLMLSAIVEGYDLGVITFANLYIKDRYFLSLASLGAAIGSLLSGPIVDKWGRRPILIFANAIYLLGGIFVALYNYKESSGLLYAGRLFTGIAIGVTSMNVPIYITEIVPNEMRGRFIAWYTFLVVLGNLIANVMSILLDQKFTIVFWIGEIFVIAQIVGIFFIIPESPRWLAKNGQVEEAAKCLELVYKPEYVEIFKRSLAREASLMQSTTQLPLLAQYKVLFSKYKRLIFIGCGLMICQ